MNEGQGDSMTNTPEELRAEIESLKIAQATQAAAMAGAEATQAAVTAGATATQAAATAGTMATMIAGSIALVTGLFLGLAMRRA
jgi:phage-related tail protein